MLIYCNGDSFTAGSCLADSIVPGYPGQFSFDDLQLEQKAVKRFKKLKIEFMNTTFVNYSQIIDPQNLHVDFLKNQELGSIKLGDQISVLEKKNSLSGPVNKNRQAHRSYKCSSWWSEHGRHFLQNNFRSIRI